MQAANGNHALQHIGFLFRVRLMQQALITGAGGAGLVCVHSGNQYKLFRNNLLKPSQTLTIVKNRILAVRRAGADNQYHFITFPGKHIRYLNVSSFFDTR